MLSTQEQTGVFYKLGHGLAYVYSDSQEEFIRLLVHQFLIG